MNDTNQPRISRASIAQRRIAAAALAASATLLGSCGWMQRTFTRSPKAAPATNTVVQATTAKEQGNTDEALRLLAAAIEQNPTLTVAHMEIGDIYLEKGNPAEAEKHFAKVVELEPSNFDANFKQGLALQLLSRLSEAVRAYLRALTIRPDDPTANLNLATAYLQLNEGSYALPYAERAVKLAPSSGAAHANLGSIYASLDRHEEAVREYRAAAELMDLTPQLLTNLGESLGKLGRYEEMASVLEQAVKNVPSATAYERLGFARFKMKQFDAAQAAFRKSIELDPAHFPALNGLGVCLLNEYINSKRTVEPYRLEALKMLRQSLRINKNQPKIIELVGLYD